LVEAERPDYNPLYVHCADPERARNLLEAAGRSYRARVPDGKVGFVSVAEFSEDFIRGISDGVAGAWRERWWSVELLLLYGIEDLSRTERAQDEFFHLFEALIRKGGRILLAADRPPSRIEDVDERIRSRFEGGLVLDLGKMEAPATAQGVRSDPEPTPPSEGSEPVPVAPIPVAPIAAAPTPAEPAIAPSRGLSRNVDMSVEEDLVVVAPPQQPPSNGESGAGWFPSQEKAVWEWPVLEDRLVEEV
jgi:hypothetical protein